VATASSPNDVAPKETKRSRSLTTPPDPSRGVSNQDFEEMVRDLGIEEEQPQQAQPAGARAGSRPAGGRRARSRAEQQGGQKPQEGGDGSDKPKKPRNRRHGRPR